MYWEEACYATSSARSLSVNNVSPDIPSDVIYGPSFGINSFLLGGFEIVSDDRSYTAYYLKYLKCEKGSGSLIREQVYYNGTDPWNNMEESIYGGVRPVVKIQISAINQDNPTSLESGYKSYNLK